MRTRTSHGLKELARLYGVETSYEGMDGQPKRASADALSATLQALGAPLAGGSARDALRARRQELDAIVVQPVQVAWDGALREIRVRLGDAVPPGRVRVRVDILPESGEAESQQADAEPGSHRPRNGWTATHTIRLGRRVPSGYHRVRIHVGDVAHETLIIAAPRRAFVDADARQWGLFFPLYALQGDEGWGVGSYTDLRRVADWAGRLGAGFVSTLPLLDTFLEAPFEPSPYSPASRLFWNELFVDVAAAPGGQHVPAELAVERQALRQGRHVDYARVAALHRRGLEMALRQAGADTRHELRALAEAQPRTADYARFRAVCDRQRSGWPAWPEPLRGGRIDEGDYDPADFEYHLFAQWQADRQLDALHGASRNGGAALYLDMPLGVNADGYDCWRMPELFAAGVSAGAPPDTLFTGGQDWGFRPLNPAPLRASGYAYLIDVIRHHLRHARMLRLDHVMSLYRLFWVPSGMSAQEGVYVRYPDDELFAILVLESARHRAVIIGEDLGTVPPAVRRTMDRHGIQRMSVLQYEASPDGTVAVPVPAPNVVASLNTHDMPTFAGFWNGSELEDQHDLGLIDEDGLAEARSRRAALRRRISRDIGAGGTVEAPLARQRLLERLAASPARYVLITLEDLWDEPLPQNVPGTSHERPNWKRRTARTLAQVMNDASLRRMLEAIHMRRQRAQEGSGTDHA